MAKMRDLESVSIDPQVQFLLDKARNENVLTAFDRADMMNICGFGSTGVCCRHCLEGPCRIAPNGKGPQTGVCGADVHQIVARSFLNHLTQGSSGHAEHGREVALTLLEVAEGKAPYQIKDVDKLYRVAHDLEIVTEDLSMNEVAKEVALKALEDFQKQTGIMNWVKLRAHEDSLNTWNKLGITPVNAHLEITKAVARNAMGCDADPTNLILGGVTMGLIDGYAGLHLSTDLQDILFGTPKAVKAKYSMAVLDEKKINIAVHGHIPMLSEKSVEWSRRLEDEAIKQGATGINIVGVCCTGNELLMRQGVSVASSFSSQELVIVSGVLEAMVVDIQCIMPGIQQVAECYHTEIITTLPYVKIAGATHVNFEPSEADEAAQEIVMKAINRFSKRDPEKISIPDQTVDAYAGFSTEQIVEALSGLNGEDPLKPVIDALVSGKIRGIAALVGCTNPREKQDYGNTVVTKELLKNNVLVVSTGCAAHSLAKHNLMNFDGLEYCGEGLKEVLEAVGNAAGLPSLPPTMHMGSCVDNSRPADLLTAIANRLGVSMNELPAVGSCPETHSPKALSIGTFFIAHGIDVHIGVSPQLSGSEFVTNVLYGDRTDEHEVNADKLFGGKLIYEQDPYTAAKLLLERIDMKRETLLNKLVAK
ncbi:carbon-monoxide dehydrogenase catalytic subunit [Anaerobacillus arseniciselenatis]|uniref:Carbon monoxide dehydrogenase n=1 Tax=Anaerobacillus arseniciselenatis TaxID=85682 RepID=A0A1S2LA55_9BACI|nr:anaerobic carbon-monoxide dehydrogenase catalytic subunit [Anaerobacillus arseniciselenatis]OIJ09369.1 carbon-monoxide dehydrogenase catalytic subunit [Anaerobacillus arseniciselenatis]